MLVTLKQILKIAEAKRIAIGSFNTPNLESMQAVIRAGERLNQPVIIMHAQVHEEMGICSIDEIGGIMLYMADRASVPVCVHLDHGTDLAYINKALDIGFTSVMYDGSVLEYEENFANTCIAAELAHRKGASIEAEIGSMGAREGGGGNDESIYTDPDAAKIFARDTGIDALACAFGTAHGLYATTPKLDFPRLERIKSLVDIPLVIHGGSGVSHEDYRKVISLGVRKINYYTYMSKAGGTNVAELSDKTFYHDIAISATNAMQKDVEDAINVFSTGKLLFSGQYVVQ